MIYYYVVLIFDSYKIKISFHLMKYVPFKCKNFVLRHFLILIITMVFTIPQNDLIELSLRLLYVTIYVLQQRGGHDDLSFY